MQNLTLVIPCVDEIGLLKKCLASIEERLPGQKVTVVKMGGWPAAEISSYALRVQLIPSRQLCASAARNVGARHADTAYVLFLDSDCVLLGSPTVWQTRLPSALNEQPHLLILQRGEAGRQIGRSIPGRWNFSRHCIEWNLIWSREHFFELGGLDEACSPGSATLAQVGEAFSICFRHFESSSAETIYLPDLVVGHPSLSNPDSAPYRQFEYAYGSSYVATRQLRRKPSLLSLFWFIRTLVGFGADISRGLRANSMKQTQRLMHARALGAWDGINRSSPRPRKPRA